MKKFTIETLLHFNVNIKVEALTKEEASNNVFNMSYEELEKYINKDTCTLVDPLEVEELFPVTLNKMIINTINEYK